MVDRVQQKPLRSRREGCTFLVREGVGGGSGPGVPQCLLHPTQRLTEPLRLLLQLPSQTSWRKFSRTEKATPLNVVD